MQTQQTMFAPQKTRWLTAQQAIANRRPNENAVLIKARYYTVDAFEILDEEHAVLGRNRIFETEAALTTLSFSGGRQSSWILEAILRGEIDRPKSFLVVTADPGVTLDFVSCEVLDVKADWTQEENAMGLVSLRGYQISRQKTHLVQYSG